MPTIIDGFSQVEYLTVFNTILFGVIASEYFSGWGSMVRHRKSIKLDWLHLAWSIFAFLTLIQNWFGIWPRIRFVNQNILYFIWALIPMFIFHLVSVVTFPSQKNIEETNFKNHFNTNSRALYVLFSIYLLSTILGSYIYDDQGNVMMQNVIRFLGIILAMVTMYFRHVKWMNIVFLVINFLGLAQFILFIPK